MSELNERIIRASPIKRGKVGLRTQGQMDYAYTMRNHDVTLCAGPAGTGKTFLAVAQALEYFHSHKISKIVLSRPAIEAGEKLGHLPGVMDEKVKPYLQPLFDSLFALLEAKDVQKMLHDGVLEVAPLAYMRGRTFNDTFMVMDEAQNVTSAQMRMYLTRIGKGSRCVVTGDLTQTDLPTKTQSGFFDALKRLYRVPQIGVAILSNADIQRHKVVQHVINAYDADHDYVITPMELMEIIKDGKSRVHTLSS